ncbi:MAG: hypothetical protein MJZ27_04575 [Bacteroidales bacterium]|nr:hypothetical protein [Bacteroidales bacterium]
MKSVFLTNEAGITSTSANYLANLAQEVIQEKKLELENTSFVDSRIVTPLCPDGLDYEKANFDLNNISNKIREIARYNTFCAWMREAIKAKENALEDINNDSFDEWLERNNKIVDDRRKLELKEEQDFINELSVGERYTMLMTEAVAASFGKLIHQDSPVSNARKQLQYRKLHPTDVQGTGAELTLTRYSIAVDSNDVENMFLSLQNEQREAEKQLNSIKSRIKSNTDEYNINARKVYADILKERSDREKLLRNEFEKDKTERRAALNKMKILVPDALKDIYEHLNSLGKKS